MYRLASVNFDESVPAVLWEWTEYVKTYLKGREMLKYPKISNSSALLLETSFKKVDMYYSFCNAMGYEPDTDWIKSTKEYLSDEIDYKLSHHLD